MMVKSKKLSLSRPCSMVNCKQGVRVENVKNFIKLVKRSHQRYIVHVSKVKRLKSSLFIAKVSRS